MTCSELYRQKRGGRTMVTGSKVRVRFIIGQLKGVKDSLQKLADEYPECISFYEYSDMVNPIIEELRYYE